MRKYHIKLRIINLSLASSTALYYQQISTICNRCAYNAWCHPFLWNLFVRIQECKKIYLMTIKCTHRLSSIIFFFIFCLKFSYFSFYFTVRMFQPSEYKYIILFYEVVMFFLSAAQSMGFSILSKLHRDLLMVLANLLLKPGMRYNQQVK